MHTLVHKTVLALLFSAFLSNTNAAPPIQIELPIPEYADVESADTLSVYLYSQAEDISPVSVQYFQDDEWQLHAPPRSADSQVLWRLTARFTETEFLEPGELVYAEVVLDGQVIAESLELLVPGPLLSVDGVIESRAGGIQYPDGSTQETAGIVAESDPTVPAYVLDGTQWSEVSGRPAGLDDGDDDTTYSAGTGLSLVDTTFSIPEGSFWELNGNTGTTGAQFLGTTDNQALELRINGGRAFRLEPGTDSPNVLAGYQFNIVSGGAEGSTISGGGRDLAINQVSGGYSTISGGAGNTASGYAATIGGGESHIASESYATIGGGNGNTVSGNGAVISGGKANQALGSFTSVGGGQTNIASSSYSTISGGVVNAASAAYSTIGGGAGNTSSDLYATVGGGRDGQAEAKYAVIAGGGPADEENPLVSNNRVTDDYGTIGGGGANRAGDGEGTKSDATFATVAGGRGNHAGSTYAVVSGGINNIASGYATTIAGGEAHVAENNYATVSGGAFNTAINQYTTVSGGSNNSATGQYSTVSGGYSNTSSNPSSSVGGGISNMASGISATIPGGQENTASGQYAFAAGYRAGAEHTGAFVWSDSSADIFSSTANDQFLINATGGVGIGTNSPPEMLTVGGNVFVPGENDPSFRGSVVALNMGGDSPFPEGISALQVVDGTTIFAISDDNHSLTIFDVSDPENMLQIKEKASNLQWPAALHVVGHFAYIASRDNDLLVIFSISGENLNSPGVVTTAAHPESLFVAGRFAYVLTGSTLEIYDVSDPANIVAKDSTTTNLDVPSGIYVADKYAYICSKANSSLAVFDISDPDNIVAHDFTTESASEPSSIHVYGNVAFVTMEASDSLAAYDVSDPDNIVFLGATSTGLSAPRDVFISGRYAYVASYGNDRLVVFDVSDPASMTVKGYSSTGLDGPVALDVSAGQVFVSSHENYSIVVFDIGHLESPAIRTGNMLASQLDITDYATVNHLDVRGGLSVGLPGALINGDLSVRGNVVPAADNSQSLGETGKRWTELHAANGVIQTSDARLKENVAPLVYGIAEVMELQPVMFNWKGGNPYEKHPGLIAQDVREILPEVVQGSTDNGDSLGLNYSELIPVLINSIKDLRGQVSNHTVTIENLKNRLQALETNAVGRDR